MSTAVVFGQNYKEQAAVFFNTFKKESTVQQYIINNLPTLEECKFVFKDNIADSFFAKITALRREVPDNMQLPDQSFEGGLKVTTFTSDDIIAERGEVNGGMLEIKEVFHPGVIFYKISFLKKKGDEHGLAFKYFVFINCRWIYFTKPYEILSDMTH
jgi:hypothetical protein